MAKAHTPEWLIDLYIRLAVRAAARNNTFKKQSPTEPVGNTLEKRLANSILGIHNTTGHPLVFEPFRKPKMREITIEEIERKALTHYSRPPFCFDRRSGTSKSLIKSPVK